MEYYTFRHAVNNDIPFLTEVIIEAEKSNSDKLSLSTLFNTPEEKVRDYIGSMLAEDIDGCEFSISSFIIAEYDNSAVGAFGAWIEAFNQSPASGILKSNLIGFTFERESIEYLKAKSYLLKPLVVKRESMSLQLEYLYVSEKHRGKKIADRLIQLLIENGKKTCPSINKVQVQVFKNNRPAVGLYQRNGFVIAESYKCDDPEILNYLPFDEKYLMEKKI